MRRATETGQISVVSSGANEPAEKKVNMASLNVTPRIRQLGRFFKKESEANSGGHLIEVGNFRIDLDSRSVRIRNRELRLSPEEFDLLVFMAAHPRRIITPHTKLSTRSGNHQVRQVEMLPTLLSLRKKLQTVTDGSRYIRTEPWVCYRFEPEALVVASNRETSEGKE
jgi:two-component system KDP operon response regulator KdpE